MKYNINKFSNKEFKFDLSNDGILRLPNVNPNKIANRKVELITLDISYVCINGLLYSTEEFKNNIYDKYTRYVCLTKSQEILNEFKAKSIYYIFPFLKYEEYSDLSLLEQYEVLCSKYQECKEYFEYEDKYRSIQQQYGTSLKFKQSRKLRFKSLLDNNFFFSVKPGFADIFKLLENRENRKIFLLDVNSMYPYAMTFNNFSNPRFLKYFKNNNINDILDGTINNGIFKCSMKIKNGLNEDELNFIKYLPINSIQEQTSIPINITLDDEINILLHANEVKFYSKYFDIKLQDGIYSKQSINHPLKQWTLDSYNKRLASSGITKDFHKFVLVLSHSISMTFSSKREIYDISSLEVILDQEYQMKYKEEEINNKYFKTRSLNKNEVLFEGYNIKNSNNVYSLYSQVLANARIHLLELYEKIYKTSKDFELCYCNIDSLHISIPLSLEKEFNSLLSELSSQTELGKLKVETTCNRGVWFEPGRYWLFQDKELVGFKNTIFNDNNTNPKCTFKKIAYFKDGKYKLNYFSLFKSLQHKKFIHKNSEKEYVYLKGNCSLVNNMVNNLRIYKDIFKRFIK